MNKIDSSAVDVRSSAQTEAVEKTWPIPVLKEGEHYYMENGFMVFTERYHAARGKCCGNACRHCPFEHVNVRARPK